MSQFVIEGAKQLEGIISVNGSKNAALPLLAASLLTPETTTLSNIPSIVDVDNLILIMKAMGARIERDGSNVTVIPSQLDANQMPQDVVGKLRGSVLLMGALLARHGKVALPLPGGDVIGARPLDVHLDAFKQLGVKITEDAGSVSLDGSKMQAGEVVLREFSVTATENILMVASSLPGVTSIHVAATEPHVVALGNMLVAMGASISGLGTHTIIVEGSLNLRGVAVQNIPDMLEAGFFILLAAATKSSLQVENVPADDLRLFFKKLDDIGVDYDVDGSTVRVNSSELKSFKLQTLPQPGIATDLQAPFAVMATQAAGTSLIHDPMYESRFRHCDELVKMGAAVTVCDPHRVIVEGPTSLRGTAISSLDIRSGATLIMAGLVAEGTTTIDGAEVIDRGYEKLDARLRAVGARIARINATSAGEKLIVPAITAVRR